MSYRLQTRKKTRNPWPKLILGLVVCLVIGFVAKSFLVGAFTKTAMAFSGIVSFVMPNGFRSDSEIKRENDSLKEELINLKAIAADREILKKENNDLKFVLGRISDNSKNILAIVLSRPSETPFDTFLLDAGSELGVAKGDKVLFGSLVIGVIVEVEKGFSKAELFSSSGNVFSGVLGNDLPVEVKGLGGGSFESMVPIGMEVEVGDTLIMPQIDSKVYGVVQNIEERVDEGFKKLFFVLPVNQNQIHSVIITK